MIIQLLTTHIFPYELLVFMVLWIVGWRANAILRQFYDYIKTNHPDLWELLGRPSMRLQGFEKYNNKWSPFDPARFTLQLTFQRFLWQKQYLGTSDPVMHAFRQKLRVYEAVFICCLLILVVVPIGGIYFFGME